MIMFGLGLDNLDMHVLLQSMCVCVCACMFVCVLSSLPLKVTDTLPEQAGVHKQPPVAMVFSNSQIPTGASGTIIIHWTNNKQVRKQTVVLNFKETTVVVLICSLLVTIQRHT